MKKLIELDAAIDAVHRNYDTILDFRSNGETVANSVEDILSELPSAQSEIIRCKDCKHRPTGENRDDLEFPDEICPCQCEDFWYNWKPKDEWYCGNGERNG